MKPPDTAEIAKSASLMSAVADLVWNPILTGTAIFFIIVLGLCEKDNAFSFGFGEFIGLGAVGLASVAIGAAISRFWTSGSVVAVGFGFLALVSDLLLHPLVRILALLGFVVTAALSVGGTQKAGEVLMAIGVILGGFGYFAQSQNKRMPEPDTGGGEASTRAAEIIVATGWFSGIIGAELFILALIGGSVFGIPLP